MVFLNQQKENQLIYKRALEILSIFTEAAQIAKAKNKVEYKLEMDETTLAGLLKKALPFITDDKKALSLARKILEDT